MGYSTQKISFKQAVKETSGYYTIQASSLDLFDGFNGDDVVSVDKSDHNPPRYYFNLKNDEFVRMDHLKTRYKTTIRGRVYHIKRGI